MAATSLIFLAAVAVMASGQQQNYRNFPQQQQQNQQQQQQPFGRQQTFQNTMYGGQGGMAYQQGMPMVGNQLRSSSQYCPPLTKVDGLNITCKSQQGEKISCSDVPPGGRATVTCRPGYVPIEDNQPTETVCQMNAVWNRDLKQFRCIEAPQNRDYTYYTGIGFYNLYLSPLKTYEEAQQTCTTDGGHLAVIDNAEERNIINNMLANSTISRRLKAGKKKNGKTQATGSKTGTKTGGAKTGSSSTTVKRSRRDASTTTVHTTTSSNVNDLSVVYIGATDEAEDGVPKTITGKPFTTNMCDPKVLNRLKNGKVDCFAIKSSATSACYVDVPCKLKRSFLCEVELKTPASIPASTTASPPSPA